MRRAPTSPIATDVLEHRIEAARELGVRARHAPAGTERPAVDVAFEVAGEDGALADAIAATRPGGRVVLVGIPAGDRTAFKASVARRKGLTLLICRRMRPEHLPARDLASPSRAGLISPRSSRPATGSTTGGRRSRSSGIAPATR